MALRIALSPKFPSPPQPPILKPHNYPSSLTLLCNRAKTLIKCSDNRDSELPSNLAKELARMNTLLVQRDEAMEKSRELLFGELCRYLSMESDEVKGKWRKMEEDDKWVLVRGFISDWGVNFHPLSARSVKELVDELLGEENGDSRSSAASVMFPNLKKFIGFSQNNS